MILNCYNCITRVAFFRYRDYDVVICDRFLTAVPMFVDNLLRLGHITEFDRAVVMALLSDLRARLPTPDLSVYLKRSADWCLEKIKERSRVSELNTCNEGYIRGLVAEYEAKMPLVKPLFVMEKTELETIGDDLLTIIEDVLGARI